MSLWTVHGVHVGLGLLVQLGYFCMHHVPPACPKVPKLVLGHCESAAHHTWLPYLDNCSRA